MKVMLKVKKLFLFGALLSAVVVAGCGGGSDCALGAALCNDKPPANVAPIARTAPPQSVVLGQVVELDASTSSDANGDTLRYSWSWVSKPEGSLAQFDLNTSVKPRFTLDVAGLYVASVVVHDGKVGSESALAVITSKELNAAPLSSAGAMQSVLTGSVVTLDGSTSSDVNRDRLAYKWSLILKPAGSTAVLTTPLEEKATFRADIPGVYAASLTVSDGKLSSESSVVLIQVADANVAPVALAGPAQSVLINSIVNLDGSGSNDSNNDRLFYTWRLISTPSGSSPVLSDASSARARFTPKVAGLYVASLVVSDGKLSSESSVVLIQVSDVNVAPVALAGPAQSVLINSIVNLDGSGSNDSNNDRLFYTWRLISTPSGSSPVLSDASSARARFTPTVAGVYVASLVVSDGQEFSQPSAAVVTVTDPQAATGLTGLSGN